MRGYVLLMVIDLAQEQILLVETPDLHHRSPDSSDLQYKSRGLKQAICCHPGLLLHAPTVFQVHLNPCLDKEDFLLGQIDHHKQSIAYILCVRTNARLLNARTHKRSLAPTHPPTHNARSHGRRHAGTHGRTDTQTHAHKYPPPDHNLVRRPQAPLAYLISHNVLIKWS